MGKRELLIVAGFLVAGVIAYQVSAPPPKQGERGIGAVFDEIRREMRSDAASATLTRTGTIDVAAAVAELRVSTMRRVPLIVTGERRKDIGYELEVTSTGPDEATAREYIGRTELRQDDLGTALALSTTFPPEGTQTARLVLRVPDRLAVRVEGSSEIEVTGVAGLGLHNTAGDVTAAAIAGSVTGSHRSGELTVTGAAGLDLTLVATRARFERISRRVALNVRSGSVVVAESTAAITAQLTATEATVDDHQGTITITGDAGEASVNRPRGEVSIDARRMVVEVLLDAPVPLSLITGDEPLRVALAGAVGLTIDALATGPGEIRTTGLDLQTTRSDAGTRLSGPIFGGGPKAVLRNSRASIVIGPAK